MNKNKLAGLITLLSILPAYLLAQGFLNNYQPFQPSKVNFLSRSCFIPTAPSSLVASQTYWNLIDLNWVDNSTNENGFNTQYCSGVSCSGFIDLFTTAPNATTYTDGSSFVHGTSQSYRVAAQASCGLSTYSNTSTIIPSYLYGAPAAQDTSYTGVAFAQWIFDEASGNITDEVNSIVLNSNGAPTYSTTATGAFVGLSPGITYPTDADFHGRATPVTELDLGTNDINAEIWFTSSSTGKSYFFTTRTSTTGKGYEAYADFSSKFFYFYMQEELGADVTAGVAYTSETPADGLIHKLRYTGVRSTKLEIFLDGVNLGNASIAALEGLEVNSYGMNVAINPTGLVEGLKGILYEIRLSNDTGANSGGTGGG